MEQIHKKRRSSKDPASTPSKKRQRLLKRSDAEARRREEARALAEQHLGDLMGSDLEASQDDAEESNVSLEDWDAEVKLTAFDDEAFIEYEDDEDDLIAREASRDEGGSRRSKRKKRKGKRKGDDPPSSSSEAWAEMRSRSIRDLRDRLGGRTQGKTKESSENALDAVLRELEQLESSDLESSESSEEEDSHNEAYAGRRRRRLHKHRLKKKAECEAREARHKDLPFWKHEGFSENPRVQDSRKFGSIEHWNRMMRQRDEERVKRMRNAPIPDRKMIVPFLGLRSPLMHHQMAALTFCLLREAIPQRGVRGGIVCDEMGSGKTLLTLSLIAFDKVCGYKRGKDLDNRLYAPPTLVVCPASLVETWRNEWQRHFAPHRMRMISLTATGGGPRANIKIGDLLEADVIVASYATVRSMYTTLLNELKYEMQHNDAEGRFEEWTRTNRTMTEMQRSKFIAACAADLRPGFRVLWSDSAEWGLSHFIFGYPFCRIVFDESTKCSSDGTLTFKAVTTIQAERRWLLSGTPIQNHLRDLYSQLRLLGVHEKTRVLSSKKEWRKFLSRGETTLDADRKITDGATQEGVDALKRKVLNVMMMRREVHNIALVDPIGRYLKRADQCASDWDAWVEWRAEESYQRLHPKARAYWLEKERLDIEMETEARDMGATVAETRSGTEEGDAENDNESAAQQTQASSSSSIQERIREAGWRSLADRKKRHLPKAVTELPAGFYWDTKQRQFLAGMRAVNTWMRSLFGFGIRDVANSLAAMREELKRISPSGEFPADPKLREIIFAASTLRWKNGERLKVWCAKRKVKPILLLGEMHRYERAVYRFITDRADKEMRSAKLNKQHGCAFVTTTFARLATTDYRFPAGAARMLHCGRGTLVPESEETRSYEANPSHARQERADMKLALYQEEGVQLEAGDNGAFKPTTEDALEGEVTAITKQLPSLYRESVSDLGQGATSNGDKQQQKKKKKNGKRAEDETSVYQVPKKPPTKAVMALRYIRACPKDDKVIIFLDMTKPIGWLLEYLQENGVSVTCMTGEHSKQRRKNALDNFHAPPSDPESAQVILLSLKLAYLGHNLQIANHVLFYSIWWNPMVDEQAKSRIDRMGQQKKMHFVYLALIGTIDEIVLTRAASKATLGTEVIGAYDGLVQSASSFLRPEENAGILIDTQPKDIKSAEHESMDALLSGRVVAFNRSQEELEHMQRFRTKEGRLNRVELVNFVISDAKRRLAEDAPPSEV